MTHSPTTDAPPPLLRRVNVTFSILMSLREKVGRIALDFGNTRKERHGDGVVPEIGGVLALMVKYALANEKDFRQWISNGQRMK